MSKKGSARDPESGNKGASNNNKPEDSTEKIGMPNMNEAVKKEIERLTKEMIQDMKSLVIMNVNYNSIDFIPEEDIEIDNQVDFMADEWNNILKQINDKIQMSNTSASTYPSFLDMFDSDNIRYNTNNGQPELKFNIELSGFGIEDLIVSFADTKSSQAST